MKTFEECINHRKEPLVGGGEFGFHLEERQYSYHNWHQPTSWFPVTWEAFLTLHDICVHPVDNRLKFYYQFTTRYFYHNNLNTIHIFTEKSTAVKFCSWFHHVIMHKTMHVIWHHVGLRWWQYCSSKYSNPDIKKHTIT